MTDVSQTLAPEPDDADPSGPLASDAPPEDDAVQEVDPQTPDAPAVTPEVQAGLDAVTELSRRYTSPVGPATIDDSITQGNRVVPRDRIEPNNPLKVLSDRVIDHYNALSPVISSLEALLVQLKELHNKIGIGV